MDPHTPPTKLSPPKIVAAGCGGALLAYGVTGILFGGAGFGTAFPDGVVTGARWLGIEGNGFTNALFIAAGTLLLSAAPGDWSARAMESLLSLAFVLLAIVASLDGDGVAGVVAANHWTVVTWAATAAIMLLGASRPVAPTRRAAGAGRQRVDLHVRR